MNTFLYGLLTEGAKASKETLKGAMDTINGVVNIVVGALGGIVTLYAIYLAYKFMTADDDTKRKNAKAQMIYAIIGVIAVFAVMILWNAVLKDALLGGTDSAGSLD